MNAIIEVPDDGELDNSLIGSHHGLNAVHSADNILNHSNLEPQLQILVPSNKRKKKRNKDLPAKRSEL